MKKTGLLNQPLSAVIAGLGHMETLVVADAGLPIPPGVERIDLAVSAGLPPFLDVLRAVLPRFLDAHGDHPPYSRLKLAVLPGPADVLYGGNGNDAVYGGWGNDYVLGGEGNDTVVGEDGNDYAFGEGGEGHLRLCFAASTDTLTRAMERLVPALR